ncbi:hypothetical protein P3S68_021150 [Capsicum galapagoense]
MTTSESTSTELLHAQAQIWNYIFDFISSTELSVINPSKIFLLSILMRFSVQSGFLNQHEDHFSLTPASRLLAKNEPFNLRSILLLNHDPVLSKAWSELGAWFQNDSPTAFHTTHGKSFWDYIGKEQHKVLSDTFNDALASDSRLNTNVLITECKHVFEGLTSLV